MKNIYISNLAYDSLKDFLKKDGWTLINPTLDKVDPAIKNHPDLLMCHLYSELYMGNHNLVGSKYPFDIIYNCAATGKFFIHNLKFTNKDLKKRAEDLGMIFINVKQGYTKCNVVVINEDAIITSDMGIYKATKDLLKVLLISPGQVLLPGMNTGFLGGASGRVGNKIIFNGDLSTHSDFNEIVNFIKAEGLEPIWFEGCPLLDIGSIISDEKF